MNKLEQAARHALETLEVSTDWDVGAKGKQLQSMKAITALRDALAEPELNLNCKSVQKRLATVWGYVKAEQAEQEPFDMDDHPPHRLCECRKCMEYFTPLPDCDAFAASGKPIAEQKPVAVVEITYGREPECYVTGNIDDFPEGVFKLYAAPVRTKDLTDDEIDKVLRAQEGNLNEQWFFNYARAVITADREKNK